MLIKVKSVKNRIKSICGLKPSINAYVIKMFGHKNDNTYLNIKTQRL